MQSDAFDRYAFITDGERYLPLVKVVVRPSGIYVLDPHAPDSGKISYHESGAFNLGQPKYDPEMIYGQLGPPEGVHGYQMVNRRAFNSHGFRQQVESSSSSGPSGRRPGPAVDIRSQPPNTRFLEIEVGVRCIPSCHRADDCLFPSLRVHREEQPIGDRLLVISASWLPLFGLGPAPT
jgi:hypothetical protein